LTGSRPAEVVGELPVQPDDIPSVLWPHIYWGDPAEDLVGLMFIQLRGHGPLNIRQRFTNVVSQAVVDSVADQKPTVRGYAIPH